jgi:hypothetical protein
MIFRKAARIVSLDINDMASADQCHLQRIRFPKLVFDEIKAFERLVFSRFLTIAMLSVRPGRAAEYDTGAMDGRIGLLMPK